ncbi:MAG: ImmA/IrrE family metallo-endopeptidase [Monoglobus pectinilyticus]|uniref:ImmA/IrrE family metallo-endopeptidase n=1 Tax=Monoglobus pectinilyticus TaxID=1981510 RepID=UPI00399AFE1C
MTVMHEIAHYLLLCVNGVKLQRNFNKQVVKAYCDPEWQAKCLAGEIMIPAHLVAGMDLFDVIEKCGVSRDAAVIRCAIYHNLMMIIQIMFWKEGR